MGLEVRHHPSAAVKEQEQRPARRRAGRNVQASGELSPAPGQPRISSTCPTAIVRPVTTAASRTISSRASVTDRVSNDGRGDSFNRRVNSCTSGSISWPSMRTGLRPASIELHTGGKRGEGAYGGGLGFER